MLNNSRYLDVDQYVLEIGTNDILLPVLEKHSFYWRLIVSVKGKVLGCVPCEDISTFKKKYEEIMLKLLDHKKKLTVIGLPLIENNLLMINQSMNTYNRAIIELCLKYNIPYVNMKELQIKLKGLNNGSYFFGKTNLGNIIDTILTTLLPFSMLVSRLRGLSVTIDSVHLNRQTAKELASVIEKNIQ
jgi:hypothetical protein